jgi:hypothetical protein
VLAAFSSVAIALPVILIRDLHITSLEYDIGETVAWPTYVREIASTWNGLSTVAPDAVPRWAAEVGGLVEFEAPCDFA